MSDRVGLKRPLLYLLAGSVVLGAVLGIVLVLRNTWGWFEIRVILTAITLSISSLCGLACDLSRAPGGKNILPRVGLALTFLASAMVILGVWLDPVSDLYWKITAIASILAVSTVHVCLLSIAALPARFQWVFLLTSLVIYGLAGLLSVMIWGEFYTQQLFQGVVVISIIDAALTLLIPLLHRIGRTEHEQAYPAAVPDDRNLAIIDKEIDALRGRLRELERRRAKAVGGG